MIAIDLIDMLRKNSTLVDAGVKHILLEEFVETVPVDRYPFINVQVTNETFIRPGGQHNFYDNEIEILLQVVTDNKNIKRNIIICEKLKAVLASYSINKGYRLDSVTVEQRVDKYIRTVSYMVKQRI